MHECAQYTLCWLKNRQHFNIKIGKEKALSRDCAKSLIFLVGRVRIELATNGFCDKGVNQHLNFAR